MGAGPGRGGPLIHPPPAPWQVPDEPLAARRLGALRAEPAGPQTSRLAPGVVADLRCRRVPSRVDSGAPPRPRPGEGRGGTSGLRPGPGRVTGDWADSPGRPCLPRPRPYAGVTRGGPGAEVVGVAEV